MGSTQSTWGHFETCPDKMKTFAAIVLAFAAVAVQADPEFKACAGFEDNSYVDPWKLTINPGFYGDKDPNGSKSLVLPEIPAIIKPFLSGKIAVEAKAMLDDGTEYLCIQNTLEVVTH